MHAGHCWNWQRVTVMFDPLKRMHTSVDSFSLLHKHTLSHATHTDVHIHMYTHFLTIAVVFFVQRMTHLGLQRWRL